MFSQNNLFCLLMCCATWNTPLECCEIHLRCCGMCFILLKGAVLWNAPPQPQCALEPVPGCTNQCFLGFRLPLALVFIWEPEEQLESSSPPPQCVSPCSHWPVYCGSCLWEGFLCALYYWPAASLLPEVCLCCFDLFLAVLEVSFCSLIWRTFLWPFQPPP